MHEPFWVYEHDTRWSEFAELLVDQKYTVFAGHFHSYTKYVFDDKNHYILATTGGGSSLRGPGFGEFDHITWVTMTDEGPKVSNLLLEGIWHDDVVVENDLELISTVSGRALRLYAEYADQDPTLATSLVLTLRNGSEEPLNLTGRFESSTVDILPAILTEVVSGNSELVRKFELKLPSANRSGVLEALNFDRTLKYDRVDRPNLSDSGEVTIVFDRLPIRRANDPVVVDGNLEEWPNLPFVVAENYGEMRKNAWE